MEARLKYKGDVAVISIEGALSIERTQPFREICVKEFLQKKIIFNMAATSFVGSTGLQAFLSTLKTLEEGSAHGVKLVGVKAEFRRVIGNLENAKIEFHESEESALGSFIHGFSPAGTGNSAAG